MNAPKLVGEIRPSQLLYTYGVGSIVDLPSLSVLVMGIDDWPQSTDELIEPRLLAAVQQIFPSVRAMHELPQNEDEPNTPFDQAAAYGVPVATFPRWMVCPACRQLAPLNSGLFELKTNPHRPDEAVYRHTGCPNSSKVPPQVIPARILVACEAGHLDDFPWTHFVHRGAGCKLEKPLLKLLEYGPAGEARDLEVRCDCGESRRLSEAFGRENRERSMPPCSGRRPHLRDFDPQPCENRSRAIALGASNLWFPVTLGVVSIPTKPDVRSQRVLDTWGIFQHVQSEADIALFRKIGNIPSDLASYSDGQIWETVQAMARGSHDMPTNQASDIKGPEWAVFRDGKESLNGPEFRLREIGLTSPWKTLHIESLVLVERLREVVCALGFARLDAVGELTDPEQRVLVRAAPISRSAPEWIPAVETRGEGLFLRFSEDALARWENSPKLEQQAQAFRSAHHAWRAKRGIEHPDEGFPGMRYVLLHSFAHALMAQLALEVGYSAASLKERIYARPPTQDGGPMAGILVYTSASDSQGTLGGLVGLGENEPFILRIVREAIRRTMFCAGDPLCAERHVDTSGHTVHAAACHACLFAPETSCERGNRYLDRSALVQTTDIARHGLAFFPEISL